MANNANHGVIGSFADRYEIDEERGGGAYGTVFRARDSRIDGRTVALKLFREGADITVAADEATYLERISGPKVVPVYDAGIHEDVPFLVSGYAPYGSLDDELLPHGMLWTGAVDLVRQVLIAVEVCHTRNVLHRDIKPSNIFLYGKHDARLGDFGVSAEMRPDGTADPHGDPPIRPPEAWTDYEMDRRSDLYQVGLTLYHLLVGSNPFTGRPDFVDAIVYGDYLPLPDAAPHVPRDVVARVRRAMAVNREDRYQSAEEMHTALRVSERTRYWTPVVPDEGVSREWHSIGSGRQIVLRVWEVGTRRFSIETRYAHSGNRLRQHCIDSVPAHRVNVRLRQAFRDLS